MGRSYILAELVVYPGAGNIMHKHGAFEETFTEVIGYGLTGGVKTNSKGIAKSLTHFSY